MHKRIFSICTCLFLFCFLLTACGDAQQAGSFLSFFDQKDSGQTGLFGVSLAIGKADAHFLRLDGACILIDTGEEEDGPAIVSFLKEQGAQKLDWLILTHLDKDHIGGADAVLDAFATEHVVLPNYEKDSQQYEQLVEALGRQWLDPVRLEGDMGLTVGEAQVQLWASGMSQYTADEDDNAFSIVTKITYGNTRFLFAGDAEERRLQELLDMGDIQCDFLKVPHHGRAEKSSQDFLKAVSPKYAVITDSKDARADKEVRSCLEQLGTVTYETMHGDVYFQSDGQNLTVEQKKSQNAD